MSKYDKYINKLLREYDRLIVDTSTKPNVNDYNDKKQKEAKFYILQDNNLYLFEVNKKSLTKYLII